MLGVSTWRSISLICLIQPKIVGRAGPFDPKWRAPPEGAARGLGPGAIVGAYAGAVAGEHAPISQGVAMLLFGLLGRRLFFVGTERKPYESGRRHRRRRERGLCEITHFPRPNSMLRRALLTLGAAATTGACSAIFAKQHCNEAMRVTRNNHLPD